jgi:hypothetical protein
MCTKNKNIPKESKYFRPEIKYCPHCGTKLEYCHSVSNKMITTLDGVYNVVNMGYRCNNTQVAMLGQFTVRLKLKPKYEVLKIFLLKLDTYDLKNIKPLEKLHQN